MRAKGHADGMTGQTCTAQSTSHGTLQDYLLHLLHSLHPIAIFCGLRRPLRQMQQVAIYPPVPDHRTVISSTKRLGAASRYKCPRQRRAWGHYQQHPPGAPRTGVSACLSETKARVKVYWPSAHSSLPSSKHGFVSIAGQALHHQAQQRRRAVDRIARRKAASALDRSLPSTHLHISALSLPWVPVPTPCCCSVLPQRGGDDDDDDDDERRWLPVVASSLPLGRCKRSGHWRRLHALWASMPFAARELLIRTIASPGFACPARVPDKVGAELSINL
ncbi:hypothetical protein BS50DRAFT_81531 [Corynespora cassiicola Philippines]|uniref:Uncharacterized protein n=1 Tax=Corynespora cassiicola Philippines TaxID=1448308 RepID=A0A2T2NHP4_CORCC|nr:hypothetical protein BS50DRAFT_81531 [Corynespora cassiicola Philippines]